MGIKGGQFLSGAPPARPPGTAEGGEETARRDAPARPPGTAEGGEETARRTAPALPPGTAEGVSLPEDYDALLAYPLSDGGSSSLAPAIGLSTLAKKILASAGFVLRGRR